MGAILVLGGLTVASLDKQKNKRIKNVATAAVPETVSDKYSVPALPFEEDLKSQEAMEQGQASDKAEYKPLLNKKSSNNRPERRR